LSLGGGDAIDGVVLGDLERLMEGIRSAGGDFVIGDGGSEALERAGEGMVDGDKPP
jgi:hypothetical protein